MNDYIEINGRKIGPDYSPYVVAELSANHNGSLQVALETIAQAKKCGASAIKLQTYTADTMTIDCVSPDFNIKGGPWDGYNLYKLYKQAETPYEWHKELFEYAKRIEITCFSTPFDESAVDLLEDLNSPAYKVASFEITDLPLIRYIASTKKPMIISTGMANLEEISETVDAVRSSGCTDLILLHCISSYPAPAKQSNLATILDLEKRYNVITGLSDHTLGTAVSVASVALGACFIEKHFILSREVSGPDSEFSIEPSELTQLCRDSKIAWQAIGEAGYDRKPAEVQNLRFRRSIYVVKDIKSGESLNESNVRRIRPGFGLEPKNYESIMGKKAQRDLSRGEALSWDMLK